jgi:two-component system response regulator PilR (NtrC family)
MKIDVRLIAATLRDLTDDVAAGRFREDLYYRLNVLPVHVPALRDRAEDIPQLARYFAGRSAARHGRDVALSDGAIEALVHQPWPGNVRELENTLERTVALEPGAVITTRSLPAALTSSFPSSLPDLAALPAEGLDLEAYLEAMGKRLMQEALERSGGVQTQAAELLKMSFRSFRYYAKKYGLLKREELYETADN